MAKTDYKPLFPVPTLAEALKALEGRVSGVHEACQSVPKIDAYDFDKLVESIKQYGLLRPIEINADRQLVDGRCRIRACLVAGVKLSDQDIIVTDADPWAIADSNFSRRHLTDDQKAMMAVKDLAVERADAAKRKAAGGEKGRDIQKATLGTAAVPSKSSAEKRAPRATEVVAAKAGVSRQKLERAEKVAKVIARDRSQG